MFKSVSSPTREDGNLVSSGDWTFSDRQHPVSTASHHNMQLAASEHNSAFANERDRQKNASHNDDSSIESNTKVPLLTSSFGRIFRKLDNMGQ
jgi:hypothetical protein